ncbi:hypothetical protein ZIOFF_073522 [Zingiber officinale]|uniref:Uncharacterized protein n=1 Tax=Zingiber officinale TaxID=94328 RepID=A0A8J5CT36_ZINOF|nr:hypothetical protein ZIOFF_073522 [Zingiber officinale]
MATCFMRLEGYPTMISLTSPLLQLQGVHAFFVTLRCLPVFKLPVQSLCKKEHFLAMGFCFLPCSPSSLCSVVGKSASSVALGMGTKVHSKSYLPGYQQTRDLNEDTNFSWTLFCEHKSVSRQLFNEFKPRAAGSCLGYDKDMLKRTILEHEAIFRKQVYELHRLYRIQMELMHELKKAQMNRNFQTPNSSMLVSPLHSELNRNFQTPNSSMLVSPLHSELNRNFQTPNSSMLVSPLHSELDEQRWHPSHRPMTTSNVIEVIDDNKASLYFLKEDVSPSKHGKCVKSSKPEETELKRFTRRILDLSLPADAYIEKEEDTKKYRRENVRGIRDDNGVELTLGSVGIRGIGKASLKSNWHSDDQSIHGLADLNEPIRDSWETEAVKSNIYKLDGLNVLSKEVAKPCLPTESKTKFSHDYLCNGNSSNSLGTLTVGITQEQQMQNNCAGHSRDVSNEYLSSFEQLKLKFKKSSSLPEQDTMGIWFREKTVPVENSASLAVNLSNPRFKASQFTPTLMNLSALNHVAASPPVLISTERIQIVDQNPVAALQGFSCFKNLDAFKQSSSIPECNKVRCNGDSQPQMEPDNLFLSHADNHRHAIQMDSTSLITIQDLQSNLGKPNLSDCNGFESQRSLKDSKFVDFQSVKGLNLNQALHCGEHGFSEQESLARKQNEASDSLVWLRKWSSCNGYADRKENDTRSNVQLNVEFQGLKIENQDHAINYENGKSIRNGRQGLENEINLNCELIIPVTENESCGASTVGIPSSLSMAVDVSKSTCEIDLEVPADALEDDNMDIDINQPIAAVDIFTSSLDVCITSAADAIVSMSIDAHTHLGRITNIPPTPTTCDSLHLLADIATCMPEAFEASGDDGLDFFESMTLKLEELKADEYGCKSFKQDKTKDDEKPTCLMLSRPQTRKRRQRKDFKNDVLPALTSLSRHEVTEDLRMLGGITSTGKWRLTVSRKTNRNKNKSRSQSGRRQLRNLAIANAEMHNSPLPEQPTNTELENAGSSIIGWGRTTRRCARQRTANACAPP